MSSASRAPGRQSWLRPSLAIAQHELRVLRRDPLPLVLLFALPVAVIDFFKPALALALFAEGYTNATGAEQAVPGVAVTFSFFLVGFVGLSFFREHGWGTWERLRACSASPSQVLLGKVLPILVVALAQLAVLFGLGVVAFGLHVKGSIAGLALLCLMLAISPLALGMALVATVKTIQQINIVANLGTVVLAGLGGALVPLSLLPGWTRRIAPATPTYWAMRGFRSIVLDGGGIGAALLPIGVLLAFTGGFVAIAVARFRLEESKVTWA